MLDDAVLDDAAPDEVVLDEVAPGTPVTPVLAPLMTAVALAGRLDEVDVLDVRWTLGGPPGIEGFVAGHVPGARYADLETVFAQHPADPVDERGRHPLPDAGELADALAGLGLAGDRPLVLVDAGNGMAAARAWWVLRWAGWPAELVCVLDGGQAAWDAAGLPVETGPGSPPAPVASAQAPVSSERALSGGHLPVVDAAEAARLAHDGRLLDARAPARWRGDVEPVDPRAGHIPGAVNLPWDVDLGADGRFRPPSQLRALLVAAGFGDEPLAVSCGSGVSAAHLVLAAEVAGLPLPALYPGSFSGWCADPDHPVETSPLPA